MLWLFFALVVDGVDGTMRAQLAWACRAADRWCRARPRHRLSKLCLCADDFHARGAAPARRARLAAGRACSAIVAVCFRSPRYEDVGSYISAVSRLWNIVVLYLFAAEVRPEAGAVIVATLVIRASPRSTLSTRFVLWLRRPATGARGRLGGTTIALLFDVPESGGRPCLARPQFRHPPRWLGSVAHVPWAKGRAIGLTGISTSTTATRCRLQRALMAAGDCLGSAGIAMKANCRRSFSQRCRKALKLLQTLQ